MEPVRVGWWEWVGLPGISHAPIRAKCDTGASSSALHAEGLELVRMGEITVARFTVLPGEAPVELQMTEKVSVRSSSGTEQLRPVVLMPIQLAGITYAIECTLTDRTPMQYPMLLGRSALAGRFTVDPALAHVHRKPRSGRR